MDSIFTRGKWWIAVLSVMFGAASCTPENRPVVYQPPPPPPQPVQVDPGPIGPPPGFQNRVRVPNLRGRHIQEARERLHARGLRIGRIDERPSRRNRPGTILNQEPDAGTYLHRGRHVDVLVAAVRWTRVPDVRGLVLPQAANRLRDAGLEPGDVKRQRKRNARPGTVFAQSEPPGKRLRSGRKVDLFVARAARLRAPDLRGIPEERAVQILQRSGLRLGKITRKRTKRHRNGDVIDQSPPPGQALRRGSRVDLTVARSARAVPPNVVRAPDLYGRHIREARRIAKHLNLRIRVAGRREGVGRIEAEHVIDQKPRKGSRLRRGAVIDVWLHQER